jgi:hypothetical protein
LIFKDLQNSKSFFYALFALVLKIINTFALNIKIPIQTDMTPLDKDLQKNKNTIEDFYSISKRVREYLPNVLSGSVDKNGYTIFVSETLAVCCKKGVITS